MTGERISGVLSSFLIPDFNRTVHPTYDVIPDKPMNPISLGTLEPMLSKGFNHCKKKKTFMFRL